MIAEPFYTIVSAIQDFTSQTEYTTYFVRRVKVRCVFI